MLEGDVGIAMAKSLNSMNAKVHEYAFRALSPKKSDRILEIGFGNGHLIPEVLSLAEDLSYAGIGISETMVNEAAAFNKGARVDVRVGSSSAIPFPSGDFDRALALNTIYFWSNPSKDLAEIRRVLRPKGKLVLGALDPAGTKTNPVFQHGFKFYEKDQLSRMLKAAGFSSVTIDVFNEVRAASDGSKYATDYFIVSADVD
jgi:ubiquinone/menaquinone biosynthesis C-methylase UbiE